MKCPIKTPSLLYYIHFHEPFKITCFVYSLLVIHVMLLITELNFTCADKEGNRK